MIPLIAIVGPTASGKTALAIQVAKDLGGEIISADSMQIYKKMDIGTAKPSLEEREGIPHYMIDVAQPGESFSVDRFAKEAHRIIKDIHQRGKVPIIAGGTGLYVDTVLNNIKLSENSFNEEVRHKLEQEAEEKGKEYMYEKLCKIDPDAAGKLHVNDLKRVIRALEICHITGKTKTEFDKESKKTEKIYNSLTFALALDRKILYNRIDIRVDKMMEEGLLEEVASLKDILCKNTTAFQGLGYKEIIDYLDNKTTLSEAVELIKKSTRNYAKRQLTWFRRNKDIIWLDAEKPLEDMLLTVRKEWESIG